MAYCHYRRNYIGKAGRPKLAEKTQKRLSKKEKLEVIKLCEQGVNQRRIAEQFGISFNRVNQICRGTFGIKQKNTIGLGASIKRLKGSSHYRRNYIGKVGHPRLERMPTQGCIEEICKHPRLMSAVNYLLQHPDISIRAVEHQFDMPRKLGHHLKYYHPQEFEKRALVRSCTTKNCAHPDFKKATAYLQLHIDAEIKSTARKFSASESAFRVHVRRHHPQEIERRQQKRACTEEKCVHSDFKDAMEFLQKHDAGVSLGEQNFKIEGALRAHLNRHHPQEIERRRRVRLQEPGCTEEKCTDSKHQAAVKYLQRYPEEETAPTALKFSTPMGTLRSHLQKYHPQEAKKRSHTADECTDAEKCDSPKFKDAVTFLQGHPGAGIEKTAFDFRVAVSTLRNHLKNYHPQELQKRQRKSNCLEEKCVNPKFEEAVGYMQQYPHVRLYPTASKFKLSIGTLHNHLSEYHPQELEKRQLRLRKKISGTIKLSRAEREILSSRSLSEKIEMARRIYQETMCNTAETMRQLRALGMGLHANTLKEWVGDIQCVDPRIAIVIKIYQETGCNLSKTKRQLLALGLDAHIKTIKKWVKGVQCIDPRISEARRIYREAGCNKEETKRQLRALGMGADDYTIKEWVKDIQCDPLEIVEDQFVQFGNTFRGGPPNAGLDIHDDGQLSKNCSVKGCNGQIFLTGKRGRPRKYCDEH